MNDALYTARWYGKKISETTKDEGTKKLADDLVLEMTAAIEGVPLKPEPVVPGKPVSALAKRLCILVGHSATDGGAAFALGGNEYKFNTKVSEYMVAYAKEHAPNLECKVIFRTNGRAHALAQAAAFKPHASIELHFNAANKKAAGSETLCTSEAIDQAFAKVVQRHVCAVFERKGSGDRGIKVLPPSGRGYTNVAGLPGSANCLVEPFFGDNINEAELAQRKQAAYAQALIDGVLAYLATA